MQVGVASLRLEGQVLSSFLTNDISGPSTYINVISYEVGGTMNTNSLVRTVLATRRFPYPITGVSCEVTSSALAPGGANVNVGVYKNGTLLGALLSHNGTAQYLSRTANYAAGDILTVEGYTDNVGVTLSVINLSIWTALGVSAAVRRSPHFITRFLEKDF